MFRSYDLTPGLLSEMQLGFLIAYLPGGVLWNAILLMMVIF